MQFELNVILLNRIMKIENEEKMFSIHFSIGEKIVSIPPQHRYYFLNTNLIKEINVKIVDQDDRLINFKGKTITLELNINSF